MSDLTMPTGPMGQVAQFFPELDYANGQAVAVSGSSAQSSAVNSGAAVIISTTDCWILPGSNPTASAGAGSLFLPANVPIGLTILSGQKIAVIENAAAGTLCIVPTKVV